MITSVDTSALLKLLVDDEASRYGVEELWLASTVVVCCELGHVEARAALTAALVLGESPSQRTRSRRATSACARRP